MEFLPLFAKLLGAPSPVGSEQATDRVIRDALEPLGYEVRSDPARNLLVRVPGRDSDRTIALAAHRDELGLIVQRVEPDGRLRVRRVGGLLPWKTGEGPVDILAESGIVPGILSVGSVHTSDPGSAIPDLVDKRALTWDLMHVFTGLDAAATREAGIFPGTPMVVAASRKGPIEFAGHVGAFLLDNKAGVAALCLLLERLAREQIEPAADLVVAFTVHEEAGCHGARYLARTVKPDILLAIDSSPVTSDTGLAVSDRPVIWMADSGGPMDRELARQLRDISRDLGCEAQQAVYSAAFSDASAAWQTGQVARAGTIGYPRENSHGYEYARLEVFDNLVSVLAEFVRSA